METRFRCNCPATVAIDVVGDKWTLVIIKQMLIEHKQTFKDFSESEEAIASNILSSRLKMLEELNMVGKKKLPNNKKTNIYFLTEKGLGLTPMLVELILWSDGNLREFQPTMTNSDTLNLINNQKEEAIKRLLSSYKENINKTLAA